MPVTLEPDQFAPTVEGPKMAGLCTALAKTFAPLLDAPEALIDAVDIRPPVWDEARPVWHLDLLERLYQVRSVPGHTARERYRVIKLSIATRWSGGKWAGLIRIAAAWCGIEPEDLPAETAEVHCWPLVAAVVFAPSVAPATAAEIGLFKEYWIKGIQDVAGWVLVVSPGNDLAFTLDIGPGLDEGILSEVI